jgi:hypothetical protein
MGGVSSGAAEDRTPSAADEARSEAARQVVKLGFFVATILAMIALQRHMSGPDLGRTLRMAPVRKRLIHARDRQRYWTVRVDQLLDQYERSAAA